MKRAAIILAALFVVGAHALEPAIAPVVLLPTEHPRVPRVGGRAICATHERAARSAASQQSSYLAMTRAGAFASRAIASQSQSMPSPGSDEAYAHPSRIATWLRVIEST